MTASPEAVPARAARRRRRSRDRRPSATPDRPRRRRRARARRASASRRGDGPADTSAAPPRGPPSGCGAPRSRSPSPLPRRWSQRARARPRSDLATRRRPSRRPGECRRRGRRRRSQPSPSGPKPTRSGRAGPGEAGASWPEDRDVRAGCPCRHGPAQLPRHGSDRSPQIVDPQCGSASNTAGCGGSSAVQDLVWQRLAGDAETSEPVEKARGRRGFVRGRPALFGRCARPMAGSEPSLDGRT